MFNVLSELIDFLIVVQDYIITVLILRREMRVINNLARVDVIITL